MHASPNSPEVVAERLIGVIHALMQSGQGPILELADRYDLTLTQLKILMLLEGAGSPLALHEIAAGTGLSLPATGRAVDALVRGKLVTRREDECDRRVKRVTLAAKGQEAMGRVATARKRSAMAALGKLESDELAALAEALEPLAAAHDVPRTEPELELSR